MKLKKLQHLAGIPVLVHEESNTDIHRLATALRFANNLDNECQPLWARIKDIVCWKSGGIFIRFDNGLELFFTSINPDRVYVKAYNGIGGEGLGDVFLNLVIRELPKAIRYEYRQLRRNKALSFPLNDNWQEWQIIINTACYVLQQF